PVSPLFPYATLFRSSPPLCAQLAVRGGGSRGDDGVAWRGAPAPVEQLADFDALVAVAATARPGRDVQHHARQVDRVVVQHGGRVAEAAHAVEINTPAQRAPRGGGVLRRNGEAPVVHGSVALEDRVRLRARARAGEPELRDEAILERAPEPLDPPLRLRRERVDGLDRQRLERLADLRGILLPAELFGRRPVIVVALQGAVLIH